MARIVGEGTQSFSKIVEGNLKIDILVPVGEKGGVENVINVTVPYLQKQGIEVRVVQLVWEGVKWTQPDIPFFALLEGLQGHTIADFIQVYYRFVIENGAPDCILSTTWPMMCQVARRVVDMLQVHNIMILSWLHAPVNRYAAAGYGDRFCLAMADAHLAISQKINSEIAEILPGRSIVNVYNPIDFNDICIDDKYQKGNNHNISAHRVYFIGRVSVEKRVDTIIQAIANVEDWSLFMIGDDTGEYPQKMKRLSQELGVEHRVHWLGWQSRPWKCVEYADAVVIASEYEGYPLVAIEAQANGLPVIATPVSGIEELITHGENGFLFPCGDWKALSDILYALGEGILPNINPEVCKKKVLPFEKDRALADFYMKIVTLYHDFLKSSQKDEVEGHESGDEEMRPNLKSEEYTIHSKQQIEAVEPIAIQPIVKQNCGEEKKLLYIPDFEQEYPTYLNVIDAFVKKYSDTNYELLMYIEEDDLLQEKMDVLDMIFAQYEEANCYVNLYVGKVEDERGLFCQVDGFITSRSKENIARMDMANLYGIPVISGVDVPIFD